MVAIAGHRLDRAGRRRLLLAAGGCLLLVLALDAWLHLVGPLPGERAIGRWWVHWSPWDAGGDLVNTLAFFDKLATPWIAAATLALVGAIVWENDGRRWALIVVTSGGVVVLTAVLKHTLGATPLWDELRGSGLNYPSGHVAYATSVFGGFALITWRHHQRWATIALLAVIPLMAVDRVIARAHLPTDTIAGFLLGASWLLAVVALLGPSDALRRERQRRGSSVRSTSAPGPRRVESAGAGSRNS